MTVGGSGWRANCVPACGNLLENNSGSSNGAARECAVFCILGMVGTVSPPYPYLRIANEHAGGSDFECATGEFDLCFQ
jgi:hypothetical protein